MADQSNYRVLTNYGSILYQFRYKQRLAVNRVFFHIPAFDAPVRVGPRPNIAIPFGMEKLEWSGYPMVKKFEDMFSRFHRIPRVTDRQASCDIVRAMRSIAR